jgi:hypothetical protein
MSRPPSVVLFLVAALAGIPAFCHSAPAKSQSARFEPQAPLIIRADKPFLYATAEINPEAAVSLQIIILRSELPQALSTSKWTWQPTRLPARRATLSAFTRLKTPAWKTCERA